MKKTYHLFLIVLTLFSCSKSDDTPVLPVFNTCNSVSGFIVSQQNDKLQISITNNSTPLYYEVSLQQASSSLNPENGSKFIVNGLTATKDLSELNMTSSTTYVFYIRAICSSSSSSDWSSPQVLTISDYCNSPNNISFSGNYLTWGSANYNTNYQVQYGNSGFSLGTGTIYSSSSTYLSGFAMNYNTSYDFYVRSFCSSSNTWSSWIGPYTYLNQQNACNLPSNLSRQIESISGTYAWVSLHWSYNGGTNFEYIVVPNGSSITNSTIYSASNAGWPVISLHRSYTYDFYMRTVCADGSRTAWTNPYLISNL
jgi:hypothetical protein